MGKNRRKRQPIQSAPESSPRPRRKGLALGLSALFLTVAGVVAWFALSSRASSRPVDEQPDIILITIDTLRADALGFAGNRNVETPFLDRLAGQSLVFTNAHAHNVVTFPSHVNILTGLYPYQHGVRDNAGYTLDPKFPTVAPFLKAKGYATAAVVGAFPLDARYGLTPGFDLYDDRYPEGTGKLDFKIAERRAEEVLKIAMAWWDKQTGKRFLWVHLYDPHAPYLPPADFAGRYAANPYLGEVAYVDSALQKYLGPLLQSEKSPMLIVTSDHGEALGDHGELTHGLFAYESTLRVPLLVHERGYVKAGRDVRPVRHVDVFPTILQRIGAEFPPDRLGKSLLDSGSELRPSYFESLSASLNRGWAPLVGLIDQGHKYIDLPIPELYDQATDPRELRNLADERRRVFHQLRNALAKAAPTKSQGARTISPEQSAQLLSLGYVTGSASNKSYTVADDPKNLVEIDNLMHRMVEYYQLGQRERAVEVAKDVVRRQPDMPIGREMLAFMLQQTEQSEAGIATLRDAIAKGTASDSMRIRLGLMLSETGRPQEAVEVLGPFSDTKDVEVLNAYGIALADLGRSAEAMRQFERVFEIDPTNATAYLNLGIVALRARNPERARQYLDQALKLDPTLPLALNTLGVIYAQSGQPTQAIELWSKAVAIDPQLYDALFNLALVAAQNRRWDVAQSALSRFIDTAPPKRYRRDIATAKQMLREIEQRRRL